MIIVLKPYEKLTVQSINEDHKLVYNIYLSVTTDGTINIKEIKK